MDDDDEVMMRFWYHGGCGDDENGVPKVVGHCIVHMSLTLRMSMLMTMPLHIPHVPDWRDAGINQLWVSRVHDPQIWAPVPILFLNIVDDDTNDIMYKCHRTNLIRKY